MLSLFRRPAHKEVTPRALAAMLAAGEAILVDVREADEFASGHVAGALSMPLSRFQASALPAGGKPVILTCAAGRRSAMALDKAAAGRPDIDTHLAGGMGAWRAAGLPVVTGN